jgi:hypothetical protein
MEMKENAPREQIGAATMRTVPVTIIATILSLKKSGKLLAQL